LNCEEAKKPRTDPVIEGIATQIVDASIFVHRELGPGLLESVYQVCPLGFLINFNVPLLKECLHRFLHPALLRS